MAVAANPTVQMVDARLRMRRSWMEGNCGSTCGWDGRPCLLSRCDVVVIQVEVDEGAS